MYKGFHISHEYSLWKDLSMGTIIFYLVTLTLVFDLLNESFNFGCIFWLVGTRALTFHMTFSWPWWVPKYLTLWPWPWYLTYLLHCKTFNLSYIFWMVCTRALVFCMSVSSDKTFLWVPTDLTLWPWPWCLVYIIKTLTCLYLLNSMSMY
jgi:hypothetical protein